MPHLGFFLLFKQQHNLALVCVKSSLVDTMGNELSVKIRIAFQKEKELVQLISDKCLDEHHGSLHVEVVLDGKLRGPSNSRTKIEMDLSFFLQNTLPSSTKSIIFILITTIFVNLITCVKKNISFQIYTLEGIWCFILSCKIQALQL